MWLQIPERLRKDIDVKIKTLYSLVPKLLLVGLLLSGSLLFSSFGSKSQVEAQTREDVCDGVEFTGGTCDDPNACANGSTAAGCAGGTLSTTVQRVINIFSMIVGIASVVMIIFGGFRYITAGGDSGKINTAQQTIIYAIVGLVVVGFAQVIVRFVIAVAS